MWNVFSEEDGRSIISSFCLTSERDTSIFQFDLFLRFASGLVAHSSEKWIDEAFPVILSISLQKASIESQLEAWSNLARNVKLRSSVWADAQVRSKVIQTLLIRPSDNQVYKALVVLWIMSFNPSCLVGSLDPSEIVSIIHKILTHTRNEKVTRTLLGLTLNLLGSEEFADFIIEGDILPFVGNLEYDKWKDSDIYSEARELAQRLSQATASCSNISRYSRELHTGTLKWSFLHTEKFWSENFKAFEQDGFALIKKLVDLLGSSLDPVSLSVACFDLGEFARYHPLGKKVVNQLGAKESVMRLMNSASREVSREALLCTQKVMLNNWRQFS